MLTKNLFEEILIKPAESSDSVYIVSGYATAGMALQHFDEMKKKTRVYHIVGLAGIDGIRSQDHSEFCAMESEIFKDNFHCRYLVAPPPAHSKVYGWYLGGIPTTGFIGSANYTLQSFSEKRREAMELISGEEILEYYDSLIDDSVSCLDDTIENSINIYRPIYSKRKNKRTPAVLDPIILAEKDTKELQLKLEELDIEKLKDIVSEFRLDPSRIVMKWKDKNRIIEHIIKASLSRAEKGDVFRT